MVKYFEIVLINFFGIIFYYYYIKLIELVIQYIIIKYFRNFVYLKKL